MFHANEAIVSRAKKRSESNAKGARAQALSENGSAGCLLSCDAARRLKRERCGDTFARRGVGAKGERALSANASGNTRCSLTRATWRRLDRDSGRLVVVRRGLSANRLEVRREHFHIGNRPTVDDLLHHIVEARTSGAQTFAVPQGVRSSFSRTKV